MVAGVYFSLQGSFNSNGVGKIKISYSGNIHKRISNIKGHNGDGLILVRAIASVNCAKLKKKLHVHFKNFRRHLEHGGREWFNLTREQIDNACVFYEKEDDLPDYQFMVKNIIGHRGHASSREYKTLWMDGSDTWEPIDSFLEEKRGHILITECLKKYWVLHSLSRGCDQAPSSSQESDSEDQSEEDFSQHTADSSNDEESLDEDYDYESSNSSSVSQEHDSQEHDSQEHDSQEHDSQEHDSQEHDSQEHDSQDSDSQEELDPDLIIYD